MKRKAVGAIVIFLLTVVVLVWQVGTAQSKQNTIGKQVLSCNAQEHYNWAIQSLTEMRTVHAGMTRADVLKVFRTEGGLSNVQQRTYVYRKFCLFKVDVTFSPIHPTYDEDGRLTCSENPNDIVKSISRPFLEGEITN